MSDFDLLNHTISSFERCLVHAMLTQSWFTVAFLQALSKKPSISIPTIQVPSIDLSTLKVMSDQFTKADLPSLRLLLMCVCLLPLQPVKTCAIAAEET